MVRTLRILLITLALLMVGAPLHAQLQPVEIGQLPACNPATNQGLVFSVKDGEDSTDCSTGRGGFPVVCLCSASGWSFLAGAPQDLSGYAEVSGADFTGPLSVTLGPNDSFTLVGSDTAQHIGLTCVDSVCTLSVAGYAPLTTANDISFQIAGETGFSVTVTDPSASAGLSHGSNAVNVSALGVYMAGSYLLVSTATPASASATCTAGTTAFDADFIYRCAATDTWKRAAISTW
jgi:hypothetical protein